MIEICTICQYRQNLIDKQPCCECFYEDDKPKFILDASMVKPTSNTPDKSTIHGVHQNYDSHYNMSDHKPIEVMQANMTADEFIGYLKGNIIKYACRMGRKDDVKKEASKIRRYAQWLEQAVSGETIKPRK